MLGVGTLAAAQIHTRGTCISLQTTYSLVPWLYHKGRYIPPFVVKPGQGMYSATFGPPHKSVHDCASLTLTPIVPCIHLVTCNVGWTNQCHLRKAIAAATISCNFGLLKWVQCPVSVLHDGLLWLYTKSTQCPIVGGGRVDGPDKTELFCDGGEIV